MFTDFSFITSPTLFIALTFCGVYLIGSIPFGLVLCKILGLGDIRDIGSGNIGATNVLRTGNKKVAAATLFLDGLKGFLPVFILSYHAQDLASIAAIGAVIGHCFPVWLKFKGGKGVATGLGVILGLSPFVGLLCLLTWLGVAIISKISSFSALIAMALAPVYIYFFADSFYTLPVLFVSVLIWIRHEANIRRILSGTEPKIGQNKDKKKK